MIDEIFSRKLISKYYSLVHCFFHGLDQCYLKLPKVKVWYNTP